MSLLSLFFTRENLLRGLLATSGLVLAGVAYKIASLGNLRTQVIPHFALFGLAFFFYVLSLWTVNRLEIKGRDLLLIFLLALVMRGAFWSGPPGDDIYRYLWDGRVTLSGTNPYVYPPDSQVLQDMRNQYWSKINHSHLETIYPPLSQGVFAVGAALGETPWTIKVLLIIFDLSTLVVLFFFLPLRNLSPGLALIYGWNPLVASEFALGGHLDTIAIFFLILALFLWEKRKHLSSTASLAASALAKYFSFLLLPFYLFKRKYWKNLGLFGSLFLLGYLPFITAGEKLFSSLFVYGQHWYHNSLIYHLLADLVDNHQLLRLPLLASLVAFSLYQGYRKEDLLRYTYLVVFFALLLSPTVYPWYLTWIVPFLCFYPNRGWLILTGTSILSYWVWVIELSTGQWFLPTEVMLWEYLPAYAFMWWEGRSQE